MRVTLVDGRRLGLRWVRSAQAIGMGRASGAGSRRGSGERCYKGSWRGGAPQGEAAFTNPPHEQTAVNRPGSSGPRRATQRGRARQPWAEQTGGQPGQSAPNTPVGRKYRPPPQARALSRGARAARRADEAAMARGPVPAKGVGKRAASPTGRAARSNPPTRSEDPLSGNARGSYGDVLIAVGGR